MRSIIETGSKLNFKFRQIDKEIHADFIKKMHDYCGPEHNLLFANILFLFSKKTLVDYLLSFLEEDIKQQWEKEKQTTASTLELHTNPAYTSYIGLLWPEPTTELASNHSHNLLSRVLLQMEQRHGLNIKYAKTAPVPTLIGFVSPDDVRRLVQQKQLWNDDPRLGGLFITAK